MDKEHMKPQNTPINCVFFKEDAIQVFDMSDDYLSLAVRIAYYPLETLLELSRNKKALLGAMAEELCHLIWDIFDEILVKVKVVEIIRNIDKDATLDELYPLSDPDILHREILERFSQDPTV